ncbi:expansin-B6-like [Salvia hispanica]|uniref:expansin-B6-like n=1 Tax=Salvia hispanica TaxID=49212 RepID=UPI002009DB71|nr:expansin-B6-like [Salvia hispanica]
MQVVFFQECSLFLSLAILGFLPSFVIDLLFGEITSRGNLFGSLAKSSARFDFTVESAKLEAISLCSCEDLFPIGDSLKSRLVEDLGLARVPIRVCNLIELNNVKAKGPFHNGAATWYGPPDGAGSDGGACGFGPDVNHAPYYGYISAGNNNLFKSGAGCGTCYEVKCIDNPACSKKAIKVTITDECAGCHDAAMHFDLSGRAFGALANPGQENNLRNAGKISLQYRRVKCNYKSNIKFKIDPGSNPYYLAFVVENLNGYGEISRIDLQPSNSDWVPMQRSWGVTWKSDLRNAQKGPFSVRITGPGNNESITAYNAIANDWQTGKFYFSESNL